jgi:hypothetical protein
MSQMLAASGSLVSGGFQTLAIGNAALNVALYS